MEHKYSLRTSQEEVNLEGGSSGDEFDKDALKKVLAGKVRAVVDSVSKSDIECNDHKLKPKIKAFSGEDPDPFSLVLIFDTCCKKMGRQLDSYIENLD